jgi:hypothetical protein
MAVAVPVSMRHAQRALLILVERLFSDEDMITAEEREELECLHLSAGEVREVFRTFLRTTFSAHEDIASSERRRLLSIAQRLHLPGELVPAVTLRAA